MKKAFVRNFTTIRTKLFIALISSHLQDWHLTSFLYTIYYRKRLIGLALDSWRTYKEKVFHLSKTNKVIPFDCFWICFHFYKIVLLTTLSFVTNSLRNFKLSIKLKTTFAAISHHPLQRSLLSMKNVWKTFYFCPP